MWLLCKLPLKNGMENPSTRFHTNRLLDIFLKQSLLDFFFSFDGATTFLSTKNVGILSSAAHFVSGLGVELVNLLETSHFPCSILACLLSWQVMWG